MRPRRGLLTLGLAGLAAASLVGVRTLSGDEASVSLQATGVPLHEVGSERFTRSVATEGLLVAVRATPITVPVEAPGVLRIAWIARDGAPVAEGDVVIRFDPTDLERELADGRADLEIAGLKIERARRTNETAQGNLILDAEVAEEELEQAERFNALDDSIFSRNEILDSQIDRELAETRATNARSRSTTLEKQGLTELELLEIEKSKAEQKIRKAEKGLAALEVRAPHAGMLVLERNWRGERPRPGDQVWPGRKLAEIPDPTEMQARAYVLEADAAGLEAGRPAEFVVEAYPGQRYPARVERVDALAKKRHHEVPVQYFQVMLVPDETNTETMKPGQRVSGTILLEEQEDALVIPPQAVFRVDEQATVFRKQGAHLVATEVTLGARSLSRVQILDGLETGDRIALRDPRTAASHAFGGESGSGPAMPVGGMP